MSNDNLDRLLEHYRYQDNLMWQFATWAVFIEAGVLLGQYYEEWVVILVGTLLLLCVAVCTYKSAIDTQNINDKIIEICKDFPLSASSYLRGRYALAVAFAVMFITNIGLCWNFLELG